MSEDSERTAFERWAATVAIHWLVRMEGNPDRYKSIYAQCALDGWMARAHEAAALVRELMAQNEALRQRVAELYVIDNSQTTLIVGLQSEIAAARNEGAGK